MTAFPFNPAPLTTLVTLAACGLAVPASADLVRDGDVVMRTIIANGAGVTQPAGGEYAGVYDDALQTLTLTGDAALRVRANEPDQFGFYAYVAFEPIGSRPVELRLEVSADAAAESAGAVLNAPGDSDYYVASRANVMERGTFDPAAPDYGDLGPLVGFAEDFRLLTNNESVLFDDFADEPILLEPGKAYVVTLWQEAGSFNVPDNGSDRTLSLMAGGVSDYAGLTAKLNTTVIPEPTSAAMLAAAGVLVLRRRR